jgi:starch synthase
MHILFASSEVAPFSKTGGLADVAQALPAALAKRGHRVTVMTPRYSHIDVSTWDLRRKRFRLNIPIKGKSLQGGLLERTTIEGVQLLFVDQPGMFERPGFYGQNGQDYPDNDERFAFFCHAVLDACRQMNMSPDVIHLNDWQTGPIAPLLQYMYRDNECLNTTGTLFTVHNLGYQGLFAPESMMSLGLSWQLFTPSTLEFYGKVSFIKAGLVFADKLSTVSAKYAKEIQTERLGFNLDGLLRERSTDLRGIQNGVDYQIWDPANDPHIASPYSENDLSGKPKCKMDLQRKFGLPVRPNLPLLGWVSRLTTQKGLDLFLGASEKLLDMNCQFAFLGTGDRNLEKQLEGLVEKYPSKIAYKNEYSEPLAHVVEAGADMFLMPSRYEPCGLNQIYSLRYGTVPIVRSVGGLDDTIYDVSDEPGTGFKFSEASPQALLANIKRALEMFADQPRWLQLMREGMQQDFSWDLPTRRYEALYKDAAAFRL